MSLNNFRRSQPEYVSGTGSPLRQNSTASTNSSAYSYLSDPSLPSRTSTISSKASSAYSQGGTGHKRGISEATRMSPTGGYQDGRGAARSPGRSPDHFYKSARQSLRPLPQAPVASPPGTQRHNPQNTRTRIVDHFSPDQNEDPFGPEKHHYEESISPRSRARNSHFSSPPPIVKPDLEELQKSSTSHLRTLSKFAHDNGDEFSINTPAPSVVGLQGRRQLKRTDSTIGAKGKPRPGLHGWGERNWMDKQRQFLQAYEYLCHIGEAKEWIEDIIHKPIPVIVQLEEALRDGVTLAEIVQAFYPTQPLRIYRNPKRSLRHIDNIAIFFRFLDDIELPDLFRFETIDLYERKNIPKVIYCVHALSWLLYRKGMVDFRIGNLVGQLQFEDHELEQTQKGLDKAGVSMPSFGGMGASFGAEPEPEPIETEEERLDRELKENEDSVVDIQTQARAAVVRMRLGDRMNRLWDSEDMLIDLQSRIRGDWARQIIEYRLTMQRFATGLQASARGFLARSRQRRKELYWKGREKDILMLQNLMRARKARVEVHNIKQECRSHDSGIRELQATIRGAFARRVAFDQYEATLEAEDQVQHVQAATRGMLARSKKLHDQRQLKQQSRTITAVQAAARAVVSRSAHARLHERAALQTETWTFLQSALRARHVRGHISATRSELRRQSPLAIQARIRGAIARENFHALKLSLLQQMPSVELLQRSASGYILRTQLAEQQRMLSGHFSRIALLQGLGRGAILRLQICSTMTQLDEEEDTTIQLQAMCRAMILRQRVGDLLTELDQHEDIIIELQALARASVVRTRFAEKQRHFKENMEKVVKIQSIVRGKIQGQAYKSLTNGKNPPVGTLKGFVHLLNDSDFDFDEEIEFERLRKTVVQHVRQNEMVDNYITQLDVKIALLVKNKITLDEVVKHQRHFGGHVSTLLPNTDISSRDPFDLKALNKTSRRKLEHYQELFFLLQTQPQYLARLFRRLRTNATAEKECERIKHLIMGLFGYAQKRREEYYLVKLMVRSLKEEFEGATTLEDYLRTNCFFNRLFAASIKSPRDRKFMRDVLGGLIKENFIDNRTLDLESDPMRIYQSAINNEELRTGHQSRRNPNVPREDAIRDPETRATFIHHMQDLRDITDQFFLCLEDSLHRMPFAVRFIAQQTNQNLLLRFQDTDPGLVLQHVGHWVWRNYLQPALAEPEKYGVVDRALTQEQKRNLAEVSKVLNQAVSGKEFGGENVYLQPLNAYIRESVYRFGDIWNHVISVPPAEEHYDIDEFNDLYAKTKPTLYIKMADIFSIHHLLATETPSICPAQDDVLREILRELGSVKNNENELMGVSSNEICLTLNPKLHNAQDPEADIKALFMETKRCVLYIIRVQAGASLLEVLVKPITPEDEDRWEGLVRDELSSGNHKRGAYAEASTALDIASMDYASLKRTALENVVQLESLGRLRRSNQYQDLLNEIALDIRTKHRRRIQRQRELEGVKTTLGRLDEQARYLDQQLTTYNDYIAQAMSTLHNKKGKKRFLMPFTKQWDHERELQRSGKSFKFGSYKYSARTLADKGVLVHWKGYTERQWPGIDLTISSNEVGVFTIDGSHGTIMMQGATAQVPLDDLLQAQFNNTQFMDFFEGTLRVNVNLFLHLIMKKFYNE